MIKNSNDFCTVYKYVSQNVDEIDRESTFIREISKTDCGIRLFGIATIALIPRVPIIVCQ